LDPDLSYGTHRNNTLRAFGREYPREHSRGNAARGLSGPVWEAWLQEHLRVLSRESNVRLIPEVQLLEDSDRLPLTKIFLESRSLKSDQTNKEREPINQHPQVVGSLFQELTWSLLLLTARPVEVFPIAAKSIKSCRERLPTMPRLGQLRLE
jgi:hypothetical protein